jgi:hypothetical protein
MLFRIIAAATTNSTLVRGARALLRKVIVSNISGTVHHVKLYDKATAPTVGTDVPVLSLYIGTSASSPQIFDLEPGVLFPTGLGLEITGGATAADSDATAATASSVIVHLIFE